VQAFVFYLFATIVIASGVMTIASRNPVHSVLWLILAFFNAAGLFLLLGAEFIAMLLVIVYVGAVAVLFLFVVMMLDVDFAELRAGFAKYLPFGADARHRAARRDHLRAGRLECGRHRRRAGAAPTAERVPTSRRWGRCSTRATSTSSKRPASSCWSR
jgi:NADH-quinone oxidoreductase subunit J